MTRAYKRGSSGDPEIGARLRAARKRAGLSQEELAKKLGVTKSAVSLWESGRTAIDLEHLPALSAIVDVPVHELAYLPEGIKAARTPEEAVMLELFRKLDDEKRRSILVILAGL